MPLSSIASREYLPNLLGTWTTLTNDSSEGLKQFKIDKTNLPAGTVMLISFQTRLGPDQPFLEFDSATLAVSVAIPPPPAYGHQPIADFEFSVLFGLQIEAQIVLGALPKKGLYWALYMVH